jgi:hypothetical protein
MKVGIYDIKDIPSAVYVKGPLLVRVNKLKSLFYLLLIIIFGSGFISVILNLEKKAPVLPISVLIVFFVLAIRHPLQLYLFSKKGAPYLLVDEDGIYFKNDRYLWLEIESIKFERYRTTSFAERLHLFLKNDKKIIIDLEFFIDADIEKIAGYINHYYM